MSGLLGIVFLLCGILSAPLFASSFGVKGFSFTRVSNRVITPNGDGRNDSATFVFENGRASAGSIRIYSVRGHLVATLSINAVDTSVTWAPGSDIRSGVYLYAISIEDTVISGTIEVIR